jgi:predicted nucleic acid-binding protein
VIAYVDASALVKLIRDEAASDQLREYLGDCEVVASEIAITEVLRAVRREAGVVGDALGDLIERAISSMEEVLLIIPETAMLVRAGLLEGDRLGSLDAIHVATAAGLGEVDVFVTYDDRQAAAARLAGLVVASPGTRGSGRPGAGGRCSVA